MSHVPEWCSSRSSFLDSKWLQCLQNVFKQGLNNKIFVSDAVVRLFLCKGANVWVPDPDAVWVSAVLLQDYSPGQKQLLLQLAEGKVEKITQQHRTKLPLQEVLT